MKMDSIDTLKSLLSRNAHFVDKRLHLCGRVLYEITRLLVVHQLVQERSFQSHYASVTTEAFISSCSLETVGFGRITHFSDCIIIQL